MPTPMIELAALPTQNSSQIKNKWGDVVRQVQEQGSLAITNHSAVEMVLLTAGTYQSLLDLVARLQEREQSDLAELSARFEARLEVLQHPKSHERMRSVMAARGKAKKAPLAGESF